MKSKNKCGSPFGDRTIFKKYLRVTMLLILVSFIFLGLVMMMFVSNNWRQEKRDVLEKGARNIADIASRQVTQDENGDYQLATESVNAFLKAFSENSQSDVFVTDNSGNILLICRGTSDTFQKQALPENVMEQTLSGMYDGQSTLGGVYQKSCYVVGIPITVATENGTKAVGAVFNSVSASSLSMYRMDMLKMFVFAALAAFLISFCVVWLFSYNLVKPLRDMAAAVRSFGEGDFSVRVPVTTRDEMGELAVAFNHMADSLATGESSSRSFIANVSHELKTPMTTISGFIDGILDGTIPPEKQEHYLKIVSSEVKRLSRLVKSMLNLSRIDSGELRLRPATFDINQTVLDAMLSFEKPIEDKKLEVRGLEDSVSIKVDGDPDMIHQVVYNLIENAVKFTNEGGYIEVRTEDLKDRVVVHIKNSGEGIAPDEITRIFQRFYKTDKSRSKDKTGMGLGLYIVRTIIKLHGGEITVSSIQGEFSEFSFWLPKQHHLEENQKHSEKRLDKKTDSKKHSSLKKSKNKKTKTDSHHTGGNV